MGREGFRSQGLFFFFSVDMRPSLDERPFIAHGGEEKNNG
jgi:hypothetical protein